MNLFSGILCGLFLLFLGLQYNDPDPYLWMPIYGFVACVCGLAALKKYNKVFILSGLCILLIYTLFYIPDFIGWIKMGMPSLVETMKAEKSYIELAREFGGLVICDIVLFWQYRQAKNNGL